MISRRAVSIARSRRGQGSGGVTAGAASAVVRKLVVVPFGDHHREPRRSAQVAFSNRTGHGRQPEARATPGHVVARASLDNRTHKLHCGYFLRLRIAKVSRLGQGWHPHVIHFSTAQLIHSCTAADQYVYRKYHSLMHRTLALPPGAGVIGACSHAGPGL